MQTNPLVGGAGKAGQGPKKKSGNSLRERIILLSGGVKSLKHALKVCMKAGTQDGGAVFQGGGDSPSVVSLAQCLSSPRIKYYVALTYYIIF